MSRASVVFVAWAVLLAVLAGVEWAVFTHRPPNYYLLVVQPAFAVGGTIVLAVIAAATRRRRPAPAEVIATPDLSMPSALIGISLALMLWGSFIGLWVVFIGAGLVLLGVGGLIREIVNARRLRRSSGRQG
jgi:hypothetical protein